MGNFKQAIVKGDFIKAKHPALNMDAENFKEILFLLQKEVWPSWYDDILSKCRDAGFSPIIRQEVKEIQTVVGLVVAGLGISIVPRSTGNSHARDVSYVNIDGAAPRVAMSITWRKDDNSTIIQQFLDTAKRLI